MVGVYCVPDTPDSDAGVIADTGTPPGMDMGPFDGGTRDLGTPVDMGDPIDMGRPDFGPNLDLGSPDRNIDTDASTATPGDPGKILLRGSAVVTMSAEGNYTPGEVYVEFGDIACVGPTGGACTAQAAGASIIETNSIIAPGLVDAHNHVAFDWMPEWQPGRFWTDHTQWQSSSAYDDFISVQADNKSDAASFCAMLQWGELRGLVNGVTTMFGAPQARTCIRWLIRNPELSTGYNGWDADRMRTNTLGIDTVDMMDAQNLLNLAGSGDLTAYVIHNAEGVSMRAYDEFTDLVTLGLLIPQTVIIHGTALDASDFAMVGAAGSKLVWSPSSNIALYDDTTDVNAAVAAGVSVSISPDWTPSGTDDMLHEVRYAKGLVQTRWPGLFSDEDYANMITRIPAEQLAISQWVGTLEAGKYADIVVVSGDPQDPYGSLIDASPAEIRLVMIQGVPSYGESAIMDSMIDTPPSCHVFDACGTLRTACWEEPPGGGPVSPGSISSVITNFFPAGPLDLFDCTP